MNKLFYPRLALQNMDKNRRFYLPYLLAGMGTSAMFYIMDFIAHNAGLSGLRGGGTVASFLFVGLIIVGLFAVIFLFYTNSFLMKRRRKELGLYNILGMEKRHLAKMMAWETLFSYLIATLGGLVLGVIFSKLVFMILIKLISFPTTIAFEVSTNAMADTALFFAGIFFLILLRSLGSVHLAKPIELLHGENTGEREPKTKLLMTFLGLACMGGGYYIAITTEHPSKAVALFFLAVVLVIIGTYCLFTAGSIALLKALRAKKSFYYQTRHFTLVSGMLYRMKQNAVGLGNICILSTMVLVTLSSTITLYAGSEDAINQSYPYDFMIHVDEGGVRTLDGAALFDEMKQRAESVGCQVTDGQAIRYYSGWQEVILADGKGHTTEPAIFSIHCVDQRYHKMLTGEDLELESGQVAAYFSNYTPEENWMGFRGYEALYQVVRWLEDIPNIHNLKANIDSYFYIVFSDEAAMSHLHDFYESTPENLDPSCWMSVQIGMNLDGTDQQLVDAEYSIREVAGKGSEFVGENGEIQTFYSYSVRSRQEESQELYAMNGGFLFLGIFLGTLFAMAAVLIMYYKQISEGYEDKQRFEIMRKVGMTNKEIKQTINSQVLLVFFLPLLVAGCHLAGAFPMVSRILFLFGLTQVKLFILCTAGTFLIFALLYWVVYQITSRLYYKIVG